MCTNVSCHVITYLQLMFEALNLSLQYMTGDIDATAVRKQILNSVNFPMNAC